MLHLAHKPTRRPELEREIQYIHRIPVERGLVALGQKAHETAGEILYRNARRWLQIRTIGVCLTRASLPGDFHMRSMTALFLACATLPAFGQAINIDMGVYGGPNDLPSSAYGAAASQPGVWNGWNLDASLVDVAGQPTGAQVGALPLFLSTPIAGATADEAALMSDCVSGGSLSGDEQGFVAVGGLVPGKYKMFVYGYSSHVSNPGGGKYRVWDSNLGYILDTTLTPTPNWPGAQLEGFTYFKFDFTITSASQYIQIILVGRGSDAFPISTYCNGLQIVPVPSAGAGPLLGIAALMGLRRRR